MTALILPVVRSGAAAPPETLGPPVPTAATVGDELRHALPARLVVALDQVNNQIQIDVFDPLLSAPVEHLAQNFERLYPKFRDYYVSVIGIMWGFLQEDPQRFAALTIRTFQASQELIREHGPKWLGKQATLTVLEGVATVTRVSKAATKLLDRDRAANLQPPNDTMAENWGNSVIAYVMTLSGVLSPLAALANDRVPPARLENVVQLAHWSKSYAVMAYHAAKSLGFLQVLRPGPITEADEQEDRELADAGLASYAELLRDDEEG